MKLESTTIATATLLTQLLIALEKDNVLSASALDQALRESIVLNEQVENSSANRDAAKYLQDVWQVVRQSCD